MFGDLDWPPNASCGLSAIVQWTLASKPSVDAHQSPLWIYYWCQKGHPAKMLLHVPEKDHFTYAGHIHIVSLWVKGILASAGWREVWRPSPKVDPGAFIGQRQGWKTPKRTPLAVHCFCVCSGSVLLGDLLGVSKLSCRFILAFSCAYWFIVFRCIVRILCLLLYSAICWCVWLFWFNCQYLPSDWLEKTPLRTP